MKEVAILLSTYNGEKYLPQQINSIIDAVKAKINIDNIGSSIKGLLG